MSKIKAGKAPVLKEFHLECMMKGRRVIMQWFARLISVFQRGSCPSGVEECLCGATVYWKGRPRMSVVILGASAFSIS